MGKISKLIQKIEGYDWEEGRDFEVTAISVVDNENGRYEITLRQLDEKDKNPVETLVNRLHAYPTDKEIFVITRLVQSATLYQWHVEFVVDSNNNYVPTKEERKVENEEEDGSDTEEHMEAEAQA